jgi:hypothetical protein
VDVRSIGSDDVVLSWRDDDLGFVHLTFHALLPPEPIDGSP